MPTLLDQFRSGASLRSVEFVQQVQARPAEAREVDAATGNTALHFACCGAAPLSVVEALLRAWPEAARETDHEGNTALHFAAAMQAHPEVVNQVITAYPEACQQRGKMNRYPLSLAFLREAPPESVALIRDAFPSAMRDECVHADWINHGIPNVLS